MEFYLERTSHHLNSSRDRKPPLPSAKLLSHPDPQSRINHWKIDIDSLEELAELGKSEILIIGNKSLLDNSKPKGLWLTIYDSLLFSKLDILTFLGLLLEKPDSQ